VIEVTSKLNNALSEMEKLKAPVDVLDFKHKSELDEARKSSCIGLEAKNIMRI
jgi:hypothetical protein